MHSPHPLAEQRIAPSSPGSSNERELAVVEPAPGPHKVSTCSSASQIRADLVTRQFALQQIVKAASDGHDVAQVSYLCTNHKAETTLTFPRRLHDIQTQLQTEALHAIRDTVQGALDVYAKIFGA